MKKYIHASKIYKNSKFKTQIDSAINNPINVELVQQLKSYLDEPELADSQSSDTVDVEERLEDGEKKIRPSHSSGNSSSSHPSSGGGDFSHNLSDDFNDVSEDLGEDKDLDDNSDADTEESDVNSATKIMSCEQLFETVNVDILKGTLNFDEATKGVRRVAIVPETKELWIYYSDNINLNDVMEAVIDIVVSNFNQLSFNRLARTDNAVVFTPIISTIDTEIQEDESK